MHTDTVIVIYIQKTIIIFFKIEMYIEVAYHESKYRETYFYSFNTLQYKAFNIC